MMERDERAATFFSSMLEVPDELDELREVAISRDIPIIRKSAEYFLRWLCSLVRPKSILEIGTAVGYSGMRMLSYCEMDCVLTTIEISEGMYEESGANFIKYGYDNRINRIFGDGCKVLPTLSDSFDMIFLDAAKGQYSNMLADCKRLVNIGGVLVADNILFDGDILESRFTLRRRDRTIHSRMREFLYELSHDSGWVVDFLGDGDGLAVATRTDENETT